MIVGSRRKQRGALRTHDSAGPGEAPLPPELVQRSLPLYFSKRGCVERAHLYLSVSRARAAVESHLSISHLYRL